MIQRRPRVRYTELTSLLDVLFIVLFAALLHAAQLVRLAQEPEPSLATRPEDPRLGPAREPSHPHQTVSEDPAELRREAARSLVAQSARAGLVQARVSAQGRILHLHVEKDGQVRDLAVDIPLVERVPDPDVGLAYLGRRIPDMRACAAIRRALGLKDLGGALVMLRPDRPLSELAVALVEGLREDQLHCYPEEKGLAVIIDGLASTGSSQKDMP